MLKFFDLKLHDGGAGVGGIVSPAANDSQPVQVVYGKQPTEPAPAPAPAAEPVVDRVAEYGKVKESFKDLYDADVKGHIDRRLKGTKKEIGEMKATLDPVMKFFGLSDLNDLKDFALTELASKIPGGYVPPQFTDDDGDGGQAPEAMQSPADLATQAIALTEQFPDFNAETEIPALEPMLKTGMTLEQAYKVAHFDEILQRETLKAAEAQKRATIEAIRTRGLNQVDESISKPNPAVVHKQDPRAFTPEDFKRINEMVARGQPISF